MALIWADFPSGQEGLYGDSESAMKDGIWAEVDNATLADDPDPNVAGKVLKMEAGGGLSHGIARFALPSAQATAGMASRVWLSNLPVNNNRRPTIHSYRDSSNNQEISIVVSTTGAIQVWFGDRDNTLLGTSDPVLTAQGWHHVETKVTKSATVGTVEVRVNDVTVLNLSGQNTGADSIAQVAILNQINGNGHTVYYVKDFVTWDSTGTEVNDFQGSVGVYDIVLDADVSLGGWTTSAGSTGFDLINQDGPPTDTDYVAADDTPPAAAEFTFDNLPADTVSVKGLISIVRALKTDGGDAQLQVSISPNGSDYDDGSDRPLTTAATYWYDVSEVSPDTAAAWTPSEVNSLQGKINRTL